VRWWPFRRRNGRVTAAQREEAADRALRAAQRLTPRVQRYAAGHMADLPAEEFAERVAQAFRRAT
jgi:hypothetical protein